MFAGIGRPVLLCALTCGLSAQQLHVVSSSEIQDQTLGLQFLDELNGLFYSAGWLNITADLVAHGVGSRSVRVTLVRTFFGYILELHGMDGTLAAQAY